MYKSYQDLGEQPLPNRDQYSVITLANEEHKSNTIGRNRIVVVDIYADWCQPCKQTAAAYSSLANKYNVAGKCMMVKENLDNKLTQNITGIPTFQFFLEGRMVDQVVGADLDEVEKKLLAIKSSIGESRSDGGMASHLNSGIAGYPIRQHQNAYSGGGNSGGNGGDDNGNQPYQSGPQYQQM